MNALIRERINRERRGYPVLGRYDVSDLQRAMRVALGRAHLRDLRASSPRRCASFDFRPDGKAVAL